MPTVQEMLKQSGLSDEQIAALDAKAIGAFSGVLTVAEQKEQAAQKAHDEAARLAQAAEQAKKESDQAAQQAAQAREAAEIAQRSNSQFYEETIAPALNNWGTEKANLEAQAAFYRAQNEAARAAGFVPAEAPGFTPQTFQPQSGQPQNVQARDSQGRYVAGAPGSTPGSPTFMEEIDQRLGAGLSNMGWIMQNYQRLNNGQFLPDPIDQLAKEAENARLPIRDYVARKYDFAGKEAALRQKAQEDHDAKVRAETAAPYEAKLAEEQALRKKAIEENDRKWAEKIGSNPDVRIAVQSKFADVARAVKANERPDPLNLTLQQRRQATAQAIRTETAEQTTAA
jgi:hypothetical protein